MSDCSSHDCAPRSPIRKKRKDLHVVVPIEWRSEAQLQPPPPPKQAIGDTIMLSNGSVLTRVPKLCSSTHEHYDYKVSNLGDLIALADYYEDMFDHRKTSNIHLRMMSRLSPHLRELDGLVGMNQVKDQVVSLVLFFSQKLDNVNHDMLHSVIYGSPGVGKTRLIYILANIFATLGITKENKVIFVKRADLIGQYLGQTATKTKRVLEDAQGGILVIDEAYSLGDTEQRDSFSRECLDTLNQYLSECRRDLICIIAGYKDDLENRFFKTNAGLKRRFAFQYTIPDYTAHQLREIFMQNVRDCGWTIEEHAAPMGFFEENHHCFLHNGGDMELLFGKIKFEHARRVFSKMLYEQKRITREDVLAGMDRFLENIVRKKEDPPPFMMYT